MTTNPFPNLVWSLPTFRLSPRLEVARDQLLITVNNNLNSDIAKVLINGNYLPRRPEKQKHAKKKVDQFTKRIIADAKESKSAADQIQVYSLILAHGNELNEWNLPLPDKPVSLEPERNPYTPVAFNEHLPQGRLWEKMFYESLDKNVCLSHNALVGQLLFCAILRGGLLHKDSVTSLLLQINEPLCIVDDTSFINLSLQWRKKESQEHRRWFPDPLTEILILKYGEVDLEINNNPWFYIKRFFTEMKVIGKHSPKTIQN